MPNQKFIVCIHDVAPEWNLEIRHILESLRSRVGNSISAAVIPAPFSKGLGTELAHLVQESCCEIALHGYAHRAKRRIHPVGILTEYADEFSGLCPLEADLLLEKGQQVLIEVFGRRASAFVPPAWSPGPVTLELADRHGISAIVTITGILVREAQMPLAVYSWDCGRFAVLGYAGEAFGYLAGLLRTTVPCITFHPRDVSRGLFRRGLRLVDRLLERGFVPATFSEVAGTVPFTSKGLYAIP